MPYRASFIRSSGGRGTYKDFGSMGEAVSWINAQTDVFDYRIRLINSIH